jgi:hypothetical protein
MIEIKEELRDLIFPLTSDEYSNLEKSILTDGCRDALVVWNDILIDGHNRYEICIKNNIDFKTVNKEFDDIEQVKDWMDFNQLSRRNVTTDQRQILIGRRYNREKKAKEDKIGNQYTKLVIGKVCTSPNTAEKLADEYSISERTVKNYATTAKQFEKLQVEKPELAAEIWSGQKTFIEVKNALP